MATVTIPHPPIVSRGAWLASRKELLKEEKELTRHKDHVNAQRRRLPMVRLEKEYAFEAPEGRVSLVELFEGRRQLIVYHFMFDPAWEKGCPGCTRLVNGLGDLSLLNERETTFVLISRATDWRGHIVFDGLVSSHGTHACVRYRTSLSLRAALCSDRQVD